MPVCCDSNALALLINPLLLRRVSEITGHAAPDQFALSEATLALNYSLLSLNSTSPFTNYSHVQYLIGLSQHLCEETQQGLLSSVNR